MINKNNYEIYAIDYLEGNLPPELKREFEAFLSANPDIAKELQDINGLELAEDNTSYELKSYLKKSDYEQYGISYFEQLCIEDIEGIITPERKKELAEAIAKDNDMLGEYNLYSKTKLIPDLSVKYPARNSLKKAKVINFRKQILNVLQTAAVIALLFGMITVARTDFKAQLISASLAKNEVIFAQTALDIFVPDIVRPVYNSQDNANKTEDRTMVASANTQVQETVVKKEPIVTYEEVIVIPSKSIENDFKSLLHIKPDVDDFAAGSVAAKTVNVKISDANSFAIETIKKIGGDKIQIEKHKVIIKINDKQYGIYSSRGIFR